jgi:hypothetical protein
MQTKPVKLTSTSSLSVGSELSVASKTERTRDNRHANFPHNKYPYDKLQSDKSQKKLVLGCGALVYELVELIKRNPLVNQVIDLHCLPATLHNTPQLIAGEVDRYLRDNGSDYAQVLVAYGDCGTAGALDAVLVRHNATRLPGAHCYEFFTGSSEYEAIMESELGSFFLTDFLVKFFDRLVIEGLGLDRYPELKDVYFKHYKKLIYIAQTDNSELQEKAKHCAQKLGLEYHYRFVGVDGLRPVITTNIQQNAYNNIESVFRNIEVNHV